MPPNELEIANSPQSEEVTEVGMFSDTSSHNGTADKLSIQQKDVAQLNFVSQLFDIVSGCIGIDLTCGVPYIEVLCKSRSSGADEFI